MPNGVTYDGTFCNGIKHGRGLLTKADGGRYEGMFEDDKMHGEIWVTDAQGNGSVAQFYEGT